MKTIYKYELQIVDDQLIDLPLYAELLTVQMQNGRPRLWAVVDTELKTEKRYIRIHGTGHSISSVGVLKYISTFQMEGGSLIFHVFEVKK